MPVTPPRLFHARLQDMFGKLKFNFLELDAKDRFLRELLNDAPLLPQEEVTALGTALQPHPSIP